MSVIQRLAMISVHASPLAPMGGKKTGGMNVYIRCLAQELGSHGLKVDIYTRHTDPDSPQVDSSLGENVRVIGVSAGGTQSLGPDDLYPHLSDFAAGILTFATRHDLTYDLIYSHYWLSGCVANTLKSVWHIPFVHMFHTLGHMKDRVASSASSPQARIQLETQITKWADRIIAATPAEHAQLRWLYRASRKKISVVPPGVDLEQFHPMQEQVAKAHFGLPDDTQLLLFVGRIEPLKGVETAIQALALIRDRHPSVARRLRFMIVGGNPGDPSEHELAQLQTLVSQLDLTEIVEFAGAREQSQLPEFYAAATAVIMPSDYESFGMVALEAMASGTPVIASEVGGLAFLIQNGKTGFLVPTRDPDVLAHRILTLLENPEELQQMRLAAAELARQYAWSTIAENLLKVFADVAENPKAIRRMR